MQRPIPATPPAPTAMVEILRGSLDGSEGREGPVFIHPWPRVWMRTRSGGFARSPVEAELDELR
jgi:hypothetical protein